MSETVGLEGEPYNETEHEDETNQQKMLRGFANPETLAKAQATRAANSGLQATEAPTDGNTGKRRGRPPGTASRAKSKRDLDGIVTMLVGIHTMLAMATGYDDIAIDEGEGKTLAEAIANLSEHYKVKIDGKTGAILGLIYALAVVYGPRAVLISRQLREKRGGENG